MSYLFTQRERQDQQTERNAVSAHANWNQRLETTLCLDVVLTQQLKYFANLCSLSLFYLKQPVCVCELCSV